MEAFHGQDDDDLVILEMFQFLFQFTPVVHCHVLADGIGLLLGEQCEHRERHNGDDQDRQEFRTG